MTRSRFVLTLALLVALLGVTALPGPAVVQAASHREAPLIAMDPEADITDFFLFRSYEPGHEDKVVFIMDVIPGEEPSSAPNYYNFDPNVLYSFEIDNNQDGVANDIEIQFRFKTQIRGTAQALGLFLPYVALPGPITALDGPGSEGLGLRQTYSITLVRKGKRNKVADGLFAVPSNVGPRTMPNYPALAAQGIYTPTTGVRVFAGQRQDPFYIDLGGVFDTLNLRRNPPLLTAAEDVSDTVNPFGVNTIGGFSVNTIAIEVPASWVTQDGKDIAHTKYPKLGAYASTSRRQVTVLRRSGGDDAIAAGLADDSSDNASSNQANPNEHSLYLPYVGNQPSADQAVTDEANTGSADVVDAASARLVSTKGQFVQVQRLANPLVNETIIGTADKDRWNALDPEKESKFLDYYQNPRLALALNAVFHGPIPATPRPDLIKLLLQYSPSDTTLSELLRLDLSVAPVPLASQKRLTVLAHDASGTPTPDLAGWPNGRRPKDDVLDIAVRVVGGPFYITNRAGDGVNVDDAALPAVFPFLATPFDGVNRQHQNPPLP